MDGSYQRAAAKARGTIRRGMRPPTAVPALIVALVVHTAATPARAQERPLTIIAPAAPGGGWDQTARAMQRALLALNSDDIVQVENVPGAAGTIGLARFVTAERGRPEALLVTGLVMVGAIATTQSPASLADTTPIARLTGEHEVIVVPAASPHRTMRDLLDGVPRLARGGVVGRRVGGRHRRPAGASDRRSRRRCRRRRPTTWPSPAAARRWPPCSADR